METNNISFDVSDPELGIIHVSSKVYIADSKTKNPSIFITPIFGGITILENILARGFAMSGMNAFITDFMPYANFKTQVHDRAYKK